MASEASTFNGLFRKTKMCRFHLMGRCARPGVCNFAHDESELQPMPDFSFTRLCATFFNAGHCQNGDECTYAHSHRELREPSMGYGQGFARKKERPKAAQMSTRGQAQEASRGFAGQPTIPLMATPASPAPVHSHIPQAPPATPGMQATVASAPPVIFLAPGQAVAWEPLVLQAIALQRAAARKTENSHMQNSAQGFFAAEPLDTNVQAMQPPASLLEAEGGELYKGDALDVSCEKLGDVDIETPPNSWSRQSTCSGVNAQPGEFSRQLTVETWVSPFAEDVEETGAEPAATSVVEPSQDAEEVGPKPAVASAAGRFQDVEETGAKPAATSVVEPSQDASAPPPAPRMYFLQSVADLGLAFTVKNTFLDFCSCDASKPGSRRANSAGVTFFRTK